MCACAGSSHAAVSSCRAWSRILAKTLGFPSSTAYPAPLSRASARKTRALGFPSTTRACRPMTSSCGSMSSATWQARRRISANDQNAAGPAGRMDRGVTTVPDGTFGRSRLTTSASVVRSSPIAAASRSWPAGAAFQVLSGSTASSDTTTDPSVSLLRGNSSPRLSLTWITCACS